MPEKIFIIFAICVTVFLFIATGALLIFGYILFSHIAKRKPERHTKFEGTFSQRKIDFASEKRLLDEYNWFEGYKAQEISVKSYDGLKLIATAIRAKENIDPRGIILVFHGYHSSGRRDFCLHLRKLHEAGYHLLVADQRAHGRSEGDYVCYGLKERYDVISWRKKAEELFGASLPICFMGLSLGGATVLMASDLVGKDDSAVKCIVADCPFSSPWDIVRYVLWHSHKIYPFPILLFINLWYKIFAKVGLRENSAARSVSRANLPVLLFHGEEDDFVLPDCSYQIKDAAIERVKLVTLPDARHSEAIYSDENKYLEELFAFLDENMI